MFGIVEPIALWAIGLVEKAGYWGIFVSMTLESAAIPIPSEAVVPFGGFNAALGTMNVWTVAAVATLANLAGSAALYLFGLFGGRPILEKYGKYILVHKDDLAKMDAWFLRHETGAVFFSRVLPGVRTFSPLVFGAGRAKFLPFFYLTLAGSFIWNLALSYAGFLLGENWGELRRYFEKFDVALGILLVLAAATFVLKHMRRKRVDRGALIK